MRLTSALVVPIDIAKGEEKTFTFYLDGLADYSYSDTDLFAFYEGSIEKEKRLPIRELNVCNQIFRPLINIHLYINR